eukprot:gene25110-10951_t
MKVSFFGTNQDVRGEYEKGDHRGVMSHHGRAARTLNPRVSVGESSAKDQQSPNWQKTRSRCEAQQSRSFPQFPMMIHISAVLICLRSTNKPSRGLKILNEPGIAVMDSLWVLVG